MFFPSAPLSLSLSVYLCVKGGSIYPLLFLCSSWFPVLDLLVLLQGTATGAREGPSPHQMLPDPSLHSPCFPIHALLRCFDLVAGSSGGVVLQRIGAPPLPSSSSSSLELAQACDSRMELVLFPSKLGEPKHPVGWPPPTLHECTVLVNQSYVTDEIPRCQTRSASHRTLAGLPLSSYLRLTGAGDIDPEMPLKIVVTSRSTWSATFLLAWCRVVEVSAIVERTIVGLRQPAPVCAKARDSASPPPSLDSDSGWNANESDVDVDRGWVEDEDDIDADDGRNRGKGEGADEEGAAAMEEDHCMSNCEAVVTLRCPLSYRRMSLAGRGRHCTHLACFDVATYLESSLRSNAWNCPICDGPVFIDDVCVDHTVQAAIDGLGAESDSVVLFGHDYREWRGVERTENVSGTDDDTDDVEDEDGEGVVQLQLQHTHSLRDIAAERGTPCKNTVGKQKRARSGAF